MNIPIYRAKKIDSDEWVEGTGTTDFLNINNFEGYKHYNDGSRLWLWSNYAWVEVDKDTLAIHFPNTNEWYSMEEMQNIIKRHEDGNMATH